MNTKEAFETLRKNAAGELEKAQKEGVACFARCDASGAHQAADRVEKIQAVIRDISQLKNQWRTIFPENLPRPSAQSAAPQSQPITIHRQGKTQPKEYFIPILRILSALGGSADAGIVLERVREMMKDVLTAEDLESQPEGSDIRWHNAAQWGRYEMVKQGFLSDHSPRGIWEITDLGRHYLANHQ